MQPTVQQQTNYHDPEPQPSLETLWGAKARGLTGSFQVVLGVLEVILGIVVIVLPLDHLFDIVDYTGWGIWCGAFSILAGCFGIASRRSKCMVITYMVLSIIAAVICAYCTFQQIVFAISVKAIEQSSYLFNDVSNAKPHFIIYVSLAAIMFLQGVASIIGASFTCGALCPTQAASGQQVIHYVPNGTQQTVGYAPQPSTVVFGGQTPQYFSNPSLQPPMADMTKHPY